jgi:hypothetical protein
MQPHRFDRVSLVFGLLFVVFGIAFLISPSGVLALPWEWLIPAAIAGLGAALLIPAVTGRRRTPEPIGPRPPDVDELPPLEDPQPASFELRPERTDPDRTDPDRL